MSNHLRSIKILADLLRINNISLDNVAYAVNKDEAKDLYDEARGISYAVIIPPKNKLKSMVKHKRLHGAMFDGVRIVVIEENKRE